MVIDLSGNPGDLVACGGFFRADFTVNGIRIKHNSIKKKVPENHPQQKLSYLQIPFGNRTVTR